MTSNSSPHSKQTLALAKQIRMQSLRMVHKANSSHIGSALSITDIVSVLCGAVMTIDPLNPTWEERDRLILSKGHACVAIYAALAELGFYELLELDTYGQDYSAFMAHICHKVPGVEFSTGSLGHGLPFGLGKALAAKISNQKWRTFVILGDGELDEGSNWEAFMFAAHHKLDNLTAIIDCNNLQSLTTVDQTLGLEPLGDKLSAFGWAVLEVDGHDHDELLSVLSSVPRNKNKPTALIARTIKGKGVGYMENKVEWHYKSPNEEQLSAALTEVEAQQ